MKVTGLQIHTLLTFKTAYATFTSTLSKVTAVDSEQMPVHIQREHRVLFRNSYKTAMTQILVQTAKKYDVTCRLKYQINSTGVET